MSDQLAGVIVVCATLIICAALYAWVKIAVAGTISEADRKHAEESERLKKHFEEHGLGPLIPYTPPTVTPVGSLHEPFHGQVEQPVTEPQDLSTRPDLNTMKPLAVDSERPPKKGFYKPRPGSPYPAPKCVCHGEPVKPDQAVIWWPVQDSEEIRLFCVNEDA